jgi:hypothetical protein
MLYKFEDMAELFNDELLGDEITANTVGKAEQWLYAFGNRLGVKPDKIIRSFTTDELVLAYIYREVCVNKAFALPGSYSNNGSTDDFYSKKLEYYESRIKQLESRITPEQLTGNPIEYKGYRSVEIFRG